VYDSKGTSEETLGSETRSRGQTGCDRNAGLEASVCDETSTTVISSAR
jgi:hypothetical protein